MSAHTGVLKVGAHVPIEIVASAPLTVTVANLGPHSAYVGGPDVTALKHDLILAPGASTTINSTTRWVLSCARSRLAVSTPSVHEQLKAARRELAELKGEK